MCIAVDLHMWNARDPTDCLSYAVYLSSQRCSRIVCLDAHRPAPPRLSSPRAAGAPLITHCTDISPAVNMFLLGFSLCLGIVHGIVPEISKTDMDIIANMETNVAQGQTTLSDMFKEVEELMEDTQQKLEDAVHQVSANISLLS